MMTLKDFNARVRGVGLTSAALPATLAALIAMSVCGAAAAWPAPFMVKANPNELATIANVGIGCGVTDDTAKETADAVLIRSRITPLRIVRNTGEPLLQIAVNCSSSSDGATYLTVDFVALIEGKDGRRGYIRYGFDPLYVRIGVGVGDGAITMQQEAIKAMTEAAIADYLQANFPELEARP